MTKSFFAPEGLQLQPLNYTLHPLQIPAGEESLLRTGPLLVRLGELETPNLSARA